MSVQWRQTALFPLLLLTVVLPTSAALGALLLALALAVVIRRKLMHELHRQRMQDRKAERERIARDLHDTLLQGIQSLLLRIQNWETDPDIPERYRREIGVVVSRARSIVIEGRDQILGLREDALQPADLVTALAEVERSEWVVDPPKFDIAIMGQPRPVPLAVLKETIGIAREAIRNVHRHAKASQLSAVLGFSPGMMRMSISDDGVGIDPSAIDGRGRPTHFGLVGMRERAEQLGATLFVGRNGAKGTRVTLNVPLDAAVGESDSSNQGMK